MQVITKRRGNHEHPLYQISLNVMSVVKTEKIRNEADKLHMDLKKKRAPVINLHLPNASSLLHPGMDFQGVYCLNTIISLAVSSKT